MPWARAGDTSGMYPRLLAVETLPGAPAGAYPMMFGFVSLLATMSAAHTTDYVVDAGTVRRAGGEMHVWLTKSALKVGLLTKHHEKVHGVTAYRLIDDPEFLHIRSAAEVEWERKQRADTLDVAVSVPVRLRDGDLCRYCGVIVHWMGKNTKRKGTLDHLVPIDEQGNRPPVTVDTMVVACLSCNSAQHDKLGEERQQLRPAPAHPFYSRSTADWLTKNGAPTAPTQTPDADSDPTDPVGYRAASGARQRPAQAADTARAADSDPATAGYRAAHDTTADPPHAPPRLSRLTDESRVEDRVSSGTGRDRSGSAPLHASAGTGRARRSRRSSRGHPRTTDQPECP